MKSALSLPLAMLLGILSYFVADGILPVVVKPYVLQFVAWLQPILIGVMLFVAFCKMEFSAMRFCAWHFWAMLIQMASAVAFCFFASKFVHDSCPAIFFESLMLCLLCPTATAAVVVASKLGAVSVGSLAVYTVLSTLMTAFLVPLIATFLHPINVGDFFVTLLFVAKRVLPLLIIPFALSGMCRLLCPKIVSIIVKLQGLAFQVWVVALFIAMALTAQSIMKSTTPIFMQIIVGFAALIACVVQFVVGKCLGRRFHSPILASQALGQKNTVLLIWLSCAFFSPAVATVGGFYSIWHNLYNAWQLKSYAKSNTKS
jgi:BASS family bile acid:Na+ symporter